MPKSRVNTIRNRLFVSSFVIAGVALAFVYLYVVPQLESSMTSDRLAGIEQRALGQVPTIEGAMRDEPDSGELADVLDRAARSTGARITLLGVERPAGPMEGPPSASVLDDSEQLESLSSDSTEIALDAAEGRLASGIGVEPAGRRAEVAVPLEALGGDVDWVVVFSEPLREIEQNVQRIRRQVLVAVAIALSLALVSGFAASRYASRRLGQLAEAARKLADGNFATQLPESPRDELGEVAHAFNEMQIRLADLDRARSQFIANASHELRTPIFSLGGFVELLEEENLDPETRASFISSMREQIERLTKLTTDLLDLSKLDAGVLDFRPRPVDLSTLAQEVTSEFGPRAGRHGSRLQVRTPRRAALAMADPDRAAQIIRILLDNAITHTPPGTKVTVTTSFDGARATLTVFDEGPGVPKHVQRRMFDRFYTAADAGGSGLGLPIARSLALRMNGQLSFSAGKGLTSFTLDLPRASTDPAAAAEPTEATTDLAR